MSFKSSGLTTTLQAYELATLTGTQLLLLVVSDSGVVYTFTTPKLEAIVSESPGKDIILVSESQALDVKDAGDHHHRSGKMPDPSLLTLGIHHQ